MQQFLVAHGKQFGRRQRRRQVANAVPQFFRFSPYARVIFGGSGTASGQLLQQQASSMLAIRRQ